YLGRYHTPGRQHLLHNKTVRGIVIDDKDLQTLQMESRSDPACDFCVSWQPKLRRKMKRTPDTNLAFDPESPAHQLHEALRDGKPQAGAAILACRRGIGLREALKDRLQLLYRDADPRIAHRKAQAAAVSGARLGLYPCHF